MTSPFCYIIRHYPDGKVGFAYFILRDSTSGLFKVKTSPYGAPLLIDYRTALQVMSDRFKRYPDSSYEIVGKEND